VNDDQLKNLRNIYMTNWSNWVKGLSDITSGCVAPVSPFID